MGQNRTIAFVRWYGAHSWDAYADGYRAAADALVGWLGRKKWTGHPDPYLYPIGFLVRHAVEVHLKWFLIRDGHLEGKWAKDTLVATHDLAELWKAVRPRVRAHYPTGPVATLNRIEKLVLELHGLDPNGFEFRYPLKKPGKLPGGAKDHCESTLEKFPRAFDIRRLRTLNKAVCSFLRNVTLGIEGVDPDAPQLVEADDLSRLDYK